MPVPVSQILFNAIKHVVDFFFYIYCLLHERKDTSRELGLAALLLVSVYLDVMRQKRNKLTFAH